MFIIYFIYQSRVFNFSTNQTKLKDVHQNGQGAHDEPGLVNEYDDMVYVVSLQTANRTTQHPT